MFGVGATGVGGNANISQQQIQQMVSSGIINQQQAQQLSASAQSGMQNPVLIQAAQQQYQQQMDGISTRWAAFQSQIGEKSRDLQLAGGLGDFGKMTENTFLQVAGGPWGGAMQMGGVGFGTGFLDNLNTGLQQKRDQGLPQLLEMFKQGQQSFMQEFASVQTPDQILASMQGANTQTANNPFAMMNKAFGR